MEVPGRRFEVKGCDEDTRTGIYCEPCEENERKEMAISYCVDCNEFICTACERTHRGSKISKHHHILDQSTMPKQKMSSADGNFCPKHGGKLLEYYCQIHGDFSCAVCVNVVHRHCKSVEFLQDAAKGYEGSLEYKTLVAKLQDLTKVLKENVECAEKDRKKIENRLRITIPEIQLFRNELNSILDRLEDTLVRVAEAAKDENLKVIETIKESCQTMQAEISGLSLDMENSIQYKQSQQLLITSKKAKHQIGKFQEELAKLKNGNKIVFTTFKPNEQLVTMLKSVKCFGSLEEVEEGALRDEEGISKPEATGESTNGFEKVNDMMLKETASANVIDNSKRSNLHKKDPLKWRAHFVDEIRIRVKQDKADCYITSGIDMSDGSLVLADNSNSCLKRVDPVKKETSLLIKLDCKPWDIVKYKDAQYVVSAENKLIFLNIDKEVTLDRNMPVDGDCRGIACQENRIFVSCAAPNPCVKIVNVDGEVLNVIKHGSNGHQLFVNPWYLRISPDRKHILVSDFENHRVTSLNMNGSVTSQYVDKILKGPTGMAVDGEGLVFLAGRKSHNLHMISAECKQIQILLQKRAGEELPQSVMWQWNQNKLFIGHNWRTRMSNVLSVYRLQ